MGRFVKITIDAALPPDVVDSVVRACPVDIYRNDGNDLQVRPDCEDECILCGRCVELAGESLTVRRTYGTRRVVGPGGDNA